LWAGAELLRLQEAAAAQGSKAAVATAAAEALEREKAVLLAQVQASEVELQNLNAAVRHCWEQDA
jgi:hypothetical protein